MTTRTLEEAQEARKEVWQLFAHAEDQADYPMEYQIARQRAQQALKEWKAEYPVAAEEERIQKEQEQAEYKAQRKENYENSFLARGLD